MIKKLFAPLLITSSLYSIEYIDASKMNNFNLDLFVGTELGYSYNHNDQFDDSYYTYGLYMGIPIDGFEIIGKKELQRSQDYNSWLRTLTLNIPITGKYTRQWYLGLIVGHAKINFTDKSVDDNNLEYRRYDDIIYGTHFGKRYKFSRNFYVRAEIEYLYYGYTIPTRNDPNGYKIDGSLEFNYGVEWRF